MLTFHYECSMCHREYEISPTLMLCPHCETKNNKAEPLYGILLVKIRGKMTPRKITPFDLFPIEREFFPPIPVGNTPLWSPAYLQEKLGMKNLFFKDDTCNPTSSFKDRASYLVAATARKFGIKEIIVASTGNAGSSMAGIGASAGLKVTIFLPKTAPQGKLVQTLQYGANLILADGNYDLAFDLSMEYAQTRHGSLSRNTAYNPMTIEGKKSAAIEIVNDLGGFAPDFLFVPTGDGVILSGLYKGFIDLFELGLIRKIPKIIAVFAKGSNAIHLAMTADFKPIHSHTVADSIAVDVPKAGFLARSFLKEYEGETMEVSDEEILEAQTVLASNTGLFAEPSSSAAFAGFIKFRQEREVPSHATTVLLITGNGLKDTASALKNVVMPTKTIKTLKDL